ncbi:MAG TPA: F0F1 ATP synthase subunit B [Planctomycetota bacterium]|nr:F0F1 ATP synthase subunit B [Planctomycetota bacterium]
MTLALAPLLALAEEGSFNPLQFDPAATALTVVTFLVLLFILAKFAWKPILAAIESREKRIEDAIGKAESDRKSAETLLADYTSRVAHVEREIAALREKGRADAEALRADIRGKAESEAAAATEKARRDIELAKNQAVADIRREAVSLGLAVAGKVVGRSLDDADRRRLAQEVIDDLARVPAGKG